MVDEKKDKKVVGATAMKPDKKEGLAGFLEFLYNKKNGTVMGRTGKSWAKITVFYIIYYSCLAGFWAAMLAVFWTTLDMDKPKWVAGNGLIGDRPGIGVRPSQSPENVGSSVMYLHSDWTPEDSVRDKLNNNNLGYATRLEDFFKRYVDCKSESESEVCKSKKAVDCDDKDNTVAAKDGNFCNFPLAELGDCAKWPYGYGSPFKPCVFLKLNRIYNLTLDPLQDSNEPELKGSSDELIAFVDKQEPKEPFVWCEGEYPADRDLLAGKTEYFPKAQTFPLKYFPMLTKDQDQNTMVALQFSDLPVGRMVQVICKVYYKNVVHQKKTKSGLVQFQLFVEK